jgi:predicted N-acetyltransferase YhbS
MPQRPLEASDAVTARARQPHAAFAARVSFRIGGEADVPAVVPVINEAYLREAWLLPGPRMDEPRLSDELRDPGTTLIVAETDRALAGCVRLQIREADAHFGLLAVAKHARGNGLASMLIARAEQEALASGRDVMHLDCAKELGLPPLYESLGYVAGGEEFGSRWGSVQPFTLVEMRKALR